MNLMAVEALRSPPLTHFDPSFIINKRMTISHVKRGVHFPTPVKLNRELYNSEGMRCTPYREIASVLPGETANGVGILESPRLRLYVLADIEVVFSTLERRKGVVLSALAGIRSLYPYERVVRQVATLQIVC
jgi:hypothetical protein